MNPCFRVVLFLVMAALISTAGADQRPNILFAFADDWGRHASAYAKVDGPGTLNDAIRTPHFDSLAESGVLFRWRASDCVVRAKTVFLPNRALRFRLVHPVQVALLPAAVRRLMRLVARPVNAGKADALV